MRSKPNFNCQSYLYDPLTIKPEALESIKQMWLSLMAYELGLLLEKSTVAGLFDDAIKRSQDPALMQKKFEAHCKEAGVFYVVNDGTTPVAYMAAKGGAILSLFITEAYRKQGVAAVLVLWHLENVKEDLTVQCYRNNEVALEFYQKLGFEIVENQGIYYKLRYSV